MKMKAVIYLMLCLLVCPSVRAQEARQQLAYLEQEDVSGDDSDHLSWGYSLKVCNQHTAEAWVAIAQIEGFPHFGYTVTGWWIIPARACELISSQPYEDARIVHGVNGAWVYIYATDGVSDLPSQNDIPTVQTLCVGDYTPYSRDVWIATDPEPRCKTREHRRRFVRFYLAQIGRAHV